MTRLRWPLLIVSALLTALFISWHVLSSVNFLYPMWYKAMDIGETVRVYAPQNRYRHGFERTTSEEHARLFAAILHAVENRGRGLENLRYRDAAGKPIDVLLTAPEIVHLRDVARLVHAFQLFGWTCSLIFVAVGVSLRLKPAPRPPMKKMLAFFAAITLFGTVLILVLGAKTVFYKMHTWIFPPGHQWFFYYQDSLMTTLMKAPVLFAGIAAEWLVLTIAVFVALVAACVRFVPNRR